MSEETIATLKHDGLLKLREENDPDKKSLSIGVYKGNGSMTVWDNGKRPATFPINNTTNAIFKLILTKIISGESNITRFPITQRKPDENERKYVNKAQCAICVDMEADRPRIVIELAENKERFRFPVVIPKSFDVEACEFSKRDLLVISAQILLDVLNDEIPMGKRLSSFPREKTGGGGGKSWGNNNRSGGGGGGSYGGGNRRNNDDDDSDAIPF